MNKDILLRNHNPSLSVRKLIATLPLSPETPLKFCQFSHPCCLYPKDLVQLIFCLAVRSLSPPSVWNILRLPWAIMEQPLWKIAGQLFSRMFLLGVCLLCCHECIQTVHLGVNIEGGVLGLVLTCVGCHVEWPVAVGAVLIAWLR